MNRVCVLHQKHGCIALYTCPALHGASNTATTTPCSTSIRGFKQRRLLALHRPAIVVHSLEGYVFFGSAVRILREVKNSILVEETAHGTVTGRTEGPDGHASSGNGTVQTDGLSYSLGVGGCGCGNYVYICMCTCVRVYVCMYVRVCSGMCAKYMNTYVLASTNNRSCSTIASLQTASVMN